MKSLRGLYEALTETFWQRVASNVVGLVVVAGVALAVWAIYALLSAARRLVLPLVLLLSDCTGCAPERSAVSSGLDATRAGKGVKAISRVLLLGLLDLASCGLPLRGAVWRRVPIPVPEATVPKVPARPLVESSSWQTLDDARDAACAAVVKVDADQAVAALLVRSREIRDAEAARAVADVLARWEGLVRP